MNNENLQQQTALARNKRMVSFMFLMLFTIGACDLLDDDDEPKDNVVEFPLVEIPEGYVLEKVAEGFDRPTSVTSDDNGNLYTVEAGNDFLPEAETAMRIVKIEENGSRVDVVDLAGKGIKPAIVGLVWHDGYFYFTHRAEDATGPVFKSRYGGNVELLFKGIADSPAEHQINDIRMGPDGLMYVAVGVAGNSRLMDPSVVPFVERNPDVHPTPCQDIVLLGKNFKTQDFRTADEGDSVLAGAYVPFGTETQEGQVIKGVTLCGGSILKFDPAGAMGTMQTHAWGFRNIIGLTWDSRGNMYAAENGYDIRRARPVNDDIDASLRINEGTWYGVPDFSAGREPLTRMNLRHPIPLRQ
jgi:glucose/arabinose dehydrogenase